MTLLEKMGISVVDMENAQEQPSPKQAEPKQEVSNKKSAGVYFIVWIICWGISLPIIMNYELTGLLDILVAGINLAGWGFLIAGIYNLFKKNRG